MVQILFQNIGRFIILVLLQVLVLNNIQFLGFVNPYIYILFILSLPVKTNRWLMLLFSFLLGITVDAFSNTLGLHAFACVLIGFFRNLLLKLFASIDENLNFEPGFRTIGIGAYIKYVIVLVLIHHLTLFFMEAFTFAHFGVTLYRALINSLITILLIFGIQLLRGK
ncbi:rod shape-determining protein MreD [Paludibacter sp. 221]|uniref:rod shape-determining protein MreD n=1 Tax=Paludibacter sp. 221 TaxID=2302939 RepID=UPI0013D5B148|nr:rod shape-determining protein MreD [Paludibacter sp. 221]NDV47191.1 rod shape-determining protein MreD [Paludibacter sp. 221]